MPTSIAHLFGGLAAAEATPMRGRWSQAGTLAFCAVVANLPDADFLPGILVGNPVLYHREASHSLLAAVAVALSCGAIASSRGAGFRRWFSAGLLVYGSHLLLDMIATGHASGTGVPLLWPFVRGRYSVLMPLPAPFAALLELDLKKSGPGRFWSSILSLHGLGVFLGHALLFAPLPILARMIRLLRERALGPGEPDSPARRTRPHLARPLEPDPDPAE